MKKYSFMIPQPMLVEIKKLSIARDTTVTELVRAALTQFLAQEKRKSLAQKAESPAAAKEGMPLGG